MEPKKSAWNHFHPFRFDSVTEILTHTRLADQYADILNPTVLSNRQRLADRRRLNQTACRRKPVPGEIAAPTVRLERRGEIFGAEQLHFMG